MHSFVPSGTQVIRPKKPPPPPVASSPSFTYGGDKCKIPYIPYIGAIPANVKVFLASSYGIDVDLLVRYCLRVWLFAPSY